MSQNLADAVAALILGSRTLSPIQKDQFFDMVADAALSDEQVTILVKQLIAREIAFRDEENKNLDQIASENDRILQDEEQRTAPQLTEITAAFQDAGQENIAAFKNALSLLDQQLTRVFETAGRQNDADTIAALRATLKIKKS